ncbi:MerR family transcriptional regulator [Blautia pseudococcoides]|uniref:MerR family transcriptional regulator n=2 Tax=Blautia pseudococcoides TaxID=1796616 RepID=A0A1C7IAW5_9FIRM|nr:MerR family transcriptional regulator [Blautia pseudococcoides]ASU28764.1 MerR family transcriptional regulator [Blautia pseudococcoides]QQQ95407.1 MerR family transcriptional regulator [Blautia pseudococcoides]
MKTVKQVSELTGISVRTLQYYDEIGLLAPTKLTDSGYRLYDEDALETLQQILFFKELDFSLKEIKGIIENPCYDKIAAYKQQKRLLETKRKRLDKMICLLGKLEQGETCMSFKEFDTEEYFNMLSAFRKEHEDSVIKSFGSVEAFDEWVSKWKGKESILADSAMKNYGSMEEFIEAMKNNLEKMPDLMEKGKKLREGGGLERNKELTQALMSDLTRDPGCEEVQEIIRECVEITEKLYEGMEMGNNFWENMVDSYLHEKALIESLDKMYGKGASEFTGKAYRYYFQNRTEKHRINIT